MIFHLFYFLFLEIANAGRPLFPGSDVDDQLKRIFRYHTAFLFFLIQFAMFGVVMQCYSQYSKHDVAAELP